MKAPTQEHIKKHNAKLVLVLVYPVLFSQICVGIDLLFQSSLIQFYLAECGIIKKMVKSLSGNFRVGWLTVSRCKIPVWVCNGTSQARGRGVHPCRWNVRLTVTFYSDTFDHPCRGLGKTLQVFSSVLQVTVILTVSNLLDNCPRLDASQWVY